MTRAFPKDDESSQTKLSLESMLNQSAWGSRLTDSQFQKVFNATEERIVAAGKLVASAGEPVQHWLGLIEGFVKMSVTSRDGKQSTLTGLAAGSWFGEGSLLKCERRRYDVIALRDSRLAFVPLSAFTWLRDNSFAFNHYLQNLMNARLSLFIGQLEHDRLLDIDSRVAQCLASLMDPDLYPHASDAIELNQDEVALLANISRQRANAALRVLQENALIVVERGGLQILDVAGLRAFAERYGDQPS
ncbi:MAG: Crp/Fnr family transcriptional regulator [Pseudomonadota bacterium]